MSKLIKIKESILNKLFLTESNNSKAAANKTRRLIAQTSGRDVNDPMVVEVERVFENNFFGAENYSADWFIVLEPNAYSWAYGEYGDEQDAKQCLDYAKKIADKIFPEKQINREYCTEHGINYDGTVGLKELLSPEQLEELKGIKAPYREKRNAFITQVRQINDLYQADSFLEPTIEKMRMEERRAARERMANGESINTNNPNYDVVGPLTREESKVYGDKSAEDGSSPKICYTQDDFTWSGSRYSNNDKNKLFILLSKDWESVKPEHDGSEKDNVLGAPYNKLSGYDRYGMSMIFLWVTPEGTLHSSNTRWNHSGGFRVDDVDEAFTQGDIEKLMGCSLSEIANTTGMDDKLDEIKERLANGEDPRNLFDGVRKTNLNGVVEVKLGDKYNFLRENGTFLWDKPYSKWLDYITITCGLIRIEIGRRTNFLRLDGTLVWNKPYRWWFNYCDNQGYGFFAVWVGNKVNFIKNNSFVWDKPLKEWFDDYGSGFVYGNAVVKVGKKFNYLNEDGTLLWKNDEWPDTSNWFDSAERFIDVVARVAIGENLYYIEASGRLYDISYIIKLKLADGESPESMLNFGSPYKEYGKDIVRVSFRYGYNNTKYNFLRPDNTFVWDKPYNEWFDDCNDFSYKKEPVVVFLKNKYNFLKEDGTLLWKNDEWPDISNWFDGVFKIFDDSELAMVGIGDRLETYYIDINGVLYDKDKNVVSESKKKRNGKKLIHLSENTVDRLFLTEGGWSKEKKRIVNRCVAIIKHYCGWISDDTASWVEKNIEHKFFEGALAGKAKVRRYEPMITKILVSELGYPTSPFSSYKEQELVDIVKAIDKEVTDGLSPKATCIYDAESNKFTCDDYHSLIEKYHDVVFKPKEQKEAEKNAKIEKYAKESEYEIIPIPDFDTAKKYGDLSSPGNNGDYGRLCYTQGEGTWQNFTNNGLNACYLCVNKNTWKNWKNGECPPFNEYSPYDEYGLSMIWVFVGPDGSMVCSNTRWNHGAQGNIKKYNSIYGGENCDHSFNEEAITKVTKYPFREFFLPKGSVFEDIKEAIYPIKDKIIKEFENGSEKLQLDNLTITRSFENLCVLLYKEKYYAFLKISPFEFVFDGVCNFNHVTYYRLYDNDDLFYIVRGDNGKYNLLSGKKGELILNQWADNIRPIGFDEYGQETNAFEIKLENKVNIIGGDGNPLLPMWVERYTLMRKFNACVLERNKKYYLYSFDTNSFITNDTFTNFKHDNYSDEFILVGEDGSFVTMNSNKELKRMSLSNVEEFVRSHIAIGEYEIDTDSTHMFVFDEVPVTNGLATFSDDCGYGLQKGMIKDSLYAVYLNGVYNIGCNGKLLLPFWLDSTPREQQYFEGKVYTFKKDGKENVVTKDGVLFDGPIEQWPASIISVEGSNVLVLDCEGHGHQRANLTDFNRFMYDLNTPIEDLPVSIEIVGRCAVVRVLDGEENKYNLFDIDSWSFIFNDSVRVFSQDDVYTKGRHLCLVEDRETMLSNFYDTDRKEFILKSGVPSKKLTEFGQSEMVEDMPVAVLRSEVDRRVNFISPDGEFLFGPDENTWPLYEDDEEHYLEPLSAFRFNDGYAVADLHKFKLISNEHFKDIIVIEEYRYFELIRQDGSKIIYDCEGDTFVRSNLDAENHFEGYDGTSLIDYLKQNFDGVKEFIPGQVYKVGKYTVGKFGMRKNLVTVSNSGKPVLILPEWFDYVMPFDKFDNVNSNLVKCTNMSHGGSKIFNLGTMEFVTDKYVIIVYYKMGGIVIQDAKVYDSAYNLINSNGELVFDNFILSDVDDIGRYPHTTERFLKITNMEGDYNVYDFKDNKLMLNNWASSIYLLDGPYESYKNYFIVKAINDRYYAVREDGTELFTDLDATDMNTYGGNSVKITTSNGDTLIGDLETGKVHQDVRVSTESRKRSGKIIRISNDKLNKLFLY